MIPRKFPLYWISLRWEQCIFPSLYFDDIYILVFLVLQPTNHQTFQETAPLTQEFHSRNLSPGDKSQEFSVSGTHLSHCTFGSLWGLVNGHLSSISPCEALSHVVLSPEYTVKVIKFHPAPVWGRCFNQLQARLNLFCKSLGANLAVTWSMKQAEVFKDAEPAIRDR